MTRKKGLIYLNEEFSVRQMGQDQPPRAGLWSLEINVSVTQMRLSITKVGGISLKFRERYGV